MADTILGGDFTVYYSSENGQKRIEWTGTATGTRTLNELYSALLKLFDDSQQMDDKIPIRAVTPDIYAVINQWFIDDTTVEHLTGGSLYSTGWVSGTDEHILCIGADLATAFSTHDIGRTIVGATTTDTGTLLDFNTNRNLLWIRPDDPSTTGDEFDHPSEAYSIQDDPLAKAMNVSDPGGSPVWVDETDDANSAANADYQIFPAGEAIADYACWGFAQVFSALTFDGANGTAGVGGVGVWEYWNGASWSTLETGGFSDGTSDFTTAVADGQVVSWDAPTDWDTTSLNSSAQLYYVRFRITTVYSTNPVYDQAFVSGQGAGNFQEHARHGGASAAGESAWTGISSIGAIQDNTKAYIFHEDPDAPAGNFNEVKVLATKGTDSWWPQSGHLDIVLKVKEADSVFGPNPDLATSAIATFFMRQYSKTYSHFIGASLATAGGNTVVPFSTGDDLDNTTGNRQFTTDAETGGGWGSGDVDTVIREQGNNNNQAVITAVSGTGPNYTVTYYLIGTQEDFANNDIVEDVGATKSMTLDAGPTDVGPAAAPDSTVTIAFGATDVDINNGAGSRPYSITIDPTASKVPIADIYEVLKHRTRRGSTTVLLGQDGEEYVGSELQVEYNTQAGGQFAEGTKVYDQTTNAEGIIVADHDDGTTGDVILKAVRGTFTAANVLSDSPSPTQTVATFLQVDASPFAIVDETADAQSAATADTEPFPATEAIGDYVVIGGSEVFTTVSVDNTSGTQGVGGVLAWEYWNGTAWTDLETGFNFVDNTSDFTAAVGVNTITFDAPLTWEPHTLVDGTASYGPFYMIRGRVTTVYSTNPVLDQVTLADRTTATIGSTRTIVPISAAPFGTLAGGSLFGAPGVVLVTANLAVGEEQSYQLVDDDGTTQVPPNTVGITVDNLSAGDTVAVFRRTGTAINKTQFTLAAGNNLGGTSVQVNATIPADNPTNAESKVRIVSSSNEEHRYRYASYATDTFTLSTASTGTDGGGGSLTTISDAGATFQTDGVEVGDMVRNTTDGVSYSVVTQVNSEILLTVTDNGQTWASQAYSVNTLVENYGLDNAYVPFIEREADAASEGNQLVYSGSIDIRAVVRRSDDSDPILPFEQDTSITGATTVTAIRTDDDIIT